MSINLIFSVYIENYILCDLNMTLDIWPIYKMHIGLCNIIRCWGPGSGFFCILMIFSSCPSRSASETCQNTEFALDKMVHACISHSPLDFSGPVTCLAREHFSLLYHNIFRKFLNIFRKQLWIMPSNFSSDIYTHNFHVFFCTCLTIYPYEGVTSTEGREMQPNQQLSLSDNCPSGNETEPCTKF